MWMVHVYEDFRALVSLFECQTKHRTKCPTYYAAFAIHCGRDLNVGTRGSGDRHRSDGVRWHRQRKTRE